MNLLNPTIPSGTLNSSDIDLKVGVWGDNVMFLIILFSVAVTKVVIDYVTDVPIDNHFFGNYYYFLLIELT